MELVCSGPPGAFLSDSYYVPYMGNVYVACVFQDIPTTHNPFLTNYHIVVEEVGGTGAHAESEEASLLASLQHLYQSLTPYRGLWVSFLPTVADIRPHTAALCVAATTGDLNEGHPWVACGPIDLDADGRFLGVDPTRFATTAFENGSGTRLIRCRPGVGSPMLLWQQGSSVLFSEFRNFDWSTPASVDVPGRTLTAKCLPDRAAVAQREEHGINLWMIDFYDYGTKATNVGRLPGFRRTSAQGVFEPVYIIVAGDARAGYWLVERRRAIDIFSFDMVGGTIRRVDGLRPQKGSTLLDANTVNGKLCALAGTGARRNSDNGDGDIVYQYCLQIYE